MINFLAMVKCPLFWLLAVFGVQANSLDDRVSLHVLNILPYPDSSPHSGWDRAYELVPAAELAVNLINNASHILPGYKLDLVHVDSEACGISLINKGIVNTYANVFNPSLSLNVVAFAGLFCSTVTDRVAPIFSKKSVTYLQFAGSTSPVHRRDADKFPWLVHLISSSTAFNDALLGLTGKFKWKRISIIHDALSVFHKTNAENLEERAKKLNVTVTVNIPIARNADGDRIYAILNDSRIVYISALNSGSALVMCEAYKRKALYPDYVYILPDRSLAGLLSQVNNTDCTSEEIMEALEGVIFMRFRLTNINDTELISNLTYQEYHKKYLEYLMQMELATNTTLNTDNDYANVMHDQIWAFALALRNSLDTLKAANITLNSLQQQQTEQFASILRNKFENVSFQGASGSVKFNRNKEESSVVWMFQVINSTEELLGEYNPDTEEKLRMVSETGTQPPDSFDTKTLLLPLWESTLFNVVLSLFIAITTFVLVFLLAFRDRPEVKASSRSLSLAMIAGCYLVFTSSLIRNLYRGYLITDFHIFTLLCNVQVWIWMTGLTLLLSALLLHLLRTYHFFFKVYGRVSPYWKDKYMIMCILTICCGAFLILVLWTAIDTFKMVTTIEYQPSASPPFFERKSFCFCDMQGIWLGFTLSYNGILMIIISLLAVWTRKIKLSNFKSTKQINVFIVVTCMTLGFLVPLWFVIGIDRYGALNHFIVCLALSCTGVYCQLFIFIPRVFVTVKNMWDDKLMTRNGHKRVRWRRESQFSQVFHP